MIRQALVCVMVHALSTLYCHDSAADLRFPGQLVNV